MWSDVAEVNAGSLRVLSDHIVDHTGPGGKINLQHFRLHRNSDRIHIERSLTNRHILMLLQIQPVLKFAMA